LSTSDMLHSALYICTFTVAALHTYVMQTSVFIVRTL
jgi:hypothetical protein